MKNYLKTLIVFLLVFVLAFTFVACNQGEPPVDPPVEEDPPTEGGPNDNDYRLRFVYSYTALVTNDNGRDDYKDEVVTVDALWISMDNNGITDDIIAQINNLTYNGYTFVGWYSQWDTETQTGVEGTLVDFANYGKVDGDITFYGDRGNLAGANATWSVAFADGAGNAIDVSTVDSGKYPDGTSFETSHVKSGVLTISGTGKMFNFANANAVDLPWYNYRKMINKIVIEDGITSIGNNAFGGFTNLKEVVFAEGITEIGISAFSDCSNRGWRLLKTPSTLTSIGSGAFSNTSFKEVVLNDGLATIGDNAFYASTSINTIVVPKSLTSIGIAAFHPGSSSGATIDKVYYKGTPADYAGLYVSMDNPWFNEYPVTYYYTEDEAVGNAGYVLDDGTVKPCWHYAEANGVVTTTPVQYCYTVNYKLPGDKLPFTSQYVAVSPVLDENGNVIVDEEGIPSLEGIITQEIIDARANLTYHNMKFVGFVKNGSAPETLNVGDKINADITYTVKRGNILSDGGGLIWSYDSSSGTLRISKNPDAPEGASFRMWDFYDALDTGALWTHTGTEEDGKWTSGFSSLKNIKNLVIGEGVEYIGSVAFANLTSITEVILPSSLEGVAVNAFDGCSSLLGIYYMGSNVEDCQGIVNEDGSIALSGVSASAYAKTDVPVATPGNFWMEIETENGVKRICWILSADETLEGETVVYSNGVLKIGGDSVMYNYEHPELAPWYGAKSYITSVSFANNITSIAENVVNGYSNITSISLPASARIIPASAFAGTGILNDYSKYNQGILVVDGVLLKAAPTTMNKYLVETYNGITIIAGGAFDGCDAIKRVFIASTVQYINNGAFADSEIEYVFFDGVDTGWAAISNDAALNDGIRVYYKSDKDPGTDNEHWHKIGNDYVIWGCPHIFGEWKVEKESTCVSYGTQIRYCIYDESHTETEPIPYSDQHIIDETKYTPYEEATCKSNATEIAYCELKVLGCKGYHVREIEGTQLDHVFEEENYSYDGNWTCLTPGTMTAYCSLCDEASNTIPDPDYPSSGEHDWTEYVFNNDSKCNEDGTETRSCRACGTEETQTAVDSKLTTAHSYTEEVQDQKYFKEYANEDKTSIVFFKSCEWCQEKAPYTFTVDLIDPDTLDNQEVPNGMTTGKIVTSEVDGSSVKVGFRFMSETVEESVNNFLRFQQKGNGSSTTLRFSQNFVEGVTTYYFQHDFRWGGAADVRDTDHPITFKLLNAKGDEINTNAFNFYAAEGEDLKIGSRSSTVVAHIGEWVTFLYVAELTDVENNKWTVTLYVDGVKVSSASATCTTVPTLKYEPRYNSSSGHNNDMIIDFDNVVNYVKVGQDYVTTVCEGEHTFSKWNYDGDGTCTEDGHKSRVCIVDGCNVVENVLDEDHLQAGHQLVVSKIVDATCTENGYTIKACENCDYVTDPIYDLDENGENDYPATGHKWHEDPALDGFTKVDATCTENGYHERTCLICETVEKTEDYDNNGEIDDPASGHTWSEDPASDGFAQVDATCTAEGYFTRKCLVCEFVENVYDKDEDGVNDLPMIPHKWTEDAESDGFTQVDATCTAEGYFTRKCLVCEFVENVYDKDEDGVNDLPIIEHKWSEDSESDGFTKVDATCTAEGYYTRKCLVCELVENVYDMDDDGNNDLPVIDHDFVDYVYNEDKDCVTDGTMTGHCSVCGEENTIADPENPKSGHTINKYYYNNDASCFAPGTETGTCEVCGADETRTDEEKYPQLSHRLTAPTFILGTATCQHGDETIAYCMNQGCDYEYSTSDPAAALNYHSFVEVADAKYFAGYSESLTEIKYFVSCEWCGAKGFNIFSENLLATHDLTTGTLPSYITPPATLSNTTDVPTASGFYSAIVNGEWYATGKNSGGESTNAFALQAVDNTTEIFEFDFKFDGAQVVEGGKTSNWFGIIKFFNGTAKDKAETITNRTMGYADVASQKLSWNSMGGSIYNSGEWHTIRLEFSHLDGATKLVTYVDGAEISTATSTKGVVKQFVIHTRGGSYYSKVHFGFKNFSYMCIDENTFALENVVCPEGEHNLGWWVYNEDGNCAIDGTRTAICQNGTCNYTVTEKDPDHLATGAHTLSDWIYNEDQSCESAGSLTRTCADCSYFETKEDSENYPALGHTPGEYVPMENTATCQHGTLSIATCVNGCGKEFTEYGTDSLDHDYQEIANDDTCILGPNTHSKQSYYKSCSMCALNSTEIFYIDYVIPSHDFTDGTVPAYISTTLSSAVADGVYNIVLEEDGNKFWRIGKQNASSGENIKYWNFDAEGLSGNSVWFDFRWNGGIKGSSDNYAGYAKFYTVSTAGNRTQVAADNLVSNESDSPLTVFGNTFEIGEWYSVNIVFEYKDGTTTIKFHTYDSEMNHINSKTHQVVNGLVESMTIHPRSSWSTISFDFDNTAIVSTHDCVGSQVLKTEYLKSDATASTPAEYYYACSYCGKIFEETYTVESFAVGVKPQFSGMNFCENPVSSAPTKDGNSNGIGDGRYWIAQTETVTNAMGETVENTFLSYIDDNDSGSKNWSFLKDKETGKNTYTLEFDFRWQGAGAFRSDGSLHVIYYNDIGSGTTTDNKLGSFVCSSDGNILTMNGKSLEKGDWHRIKYEYVWNSTNSNFDIFVYIDGARVLSTTGTAIHFSWEPRWGSGGTNDIYWDIDNLSYTAK